MADSCPSCEEPLLGFVNKGCSINKYHSQCPIVQKVSEASIHCCPDHTCWTFRVCTDEDIRKIMKEKGIIKIKEEVK